uniref:branched-chain amino acid ABC transporter permease n=1 Tax=Cupriavidus yeoncheonensis TaxID=1462994 RepID=UPI003F490AF3
MNKNRVLSMPLNGEEVALRGTLTHSLHPGYSFGVLLLLLLLPLLLTHLGTEYYVGFFTKILIYAIAATSLNLLLGFGGMVSFGHAAFVGIGAYTVAALMTYGVTSAWVAWPAAILFSALAALVIGAISLRTHGVYFIMITLSFSQILYYLIISFTSLGGEDGISLDSRSSFSGSFDIQDDRTFYYAALVALVLVILFVQRVANAEFGQILQAIRENQTRCAALGVGVLRHKLLTFVLAGAVGGLAGALLANQSGFVSPALMHWTQSGILMVMVVLGGFGHIYGGVLGALVFLLLEEVLSGYTEHWQLALGGLLLTVVLVAPKGILGFSSRRVC